MDEAHVTIGSLRYHATSSLRETKKQVEVAMEFVNPGIGHELLRRLLGRIDEHIERAELIGVKPYEHIERAELIGVKP